MEPVDPRTAIILIGAFVILPRSSEEPAVTKCTVFHRKNQGGYDAICHTAGTKWGLFWRGLFLGRSSKPFRAPGRIASGVFYLEVSLALVGVASPAYSNNSRFHFWKQHFFIFIFEKPLPPRQDVLKP